MLNHRKFCIKINTLTVYSSDEGNGREINKLSTEEVNLSGTHVLGMYRYWTSLWRDSTGAPKEKAER
jgi:hypothetical protein